MFAIGLFLKGIFSGILNVFKLIFSDWRILLAVIALCAALFGWWKWNKIQEELADQKAKVEQVEAANQILEGNNKTLAEANQQNVLVIDQVKKDSETAKAQVQKLNTDLTISSRKINDLKNQLDNITVPAVPLSPYIAQAIDGIQKMAD